MNEADHTRDAIRKRLAQIMPLHAKAILFGSRAKGTAKANSDWDILILLDKKQLQPADYDAVTFPLTLLGWELDCEINPVMYSTREWSRYSVTPFYKNVEREGIIYW